MRDARRNPAAWLILALLPVLSGCGAVATVGSTVYSTTEAIATAVKDTMRERTESPATPGNAGSETGTPPGGREEP